MHEVIENAKEAKQVAEHTSKEHLKSKSGIIVEGLMIWQFVFEMLQPVPGDEIVGLLQEAAVCQFTVPIVWNMIHLPVSEKKSPD